MLFATDPERTPDPLAVAATLPSGSGIILRTFGDPAAKAVALELSRLARRRNLLLLISSDMALAAAVDADGVHLPQRQIALARRLRALRPGWLITGAAHSARALVAARRAGVDAALLSPVFPSASPSAKAALTPVRFAALTAMATLPVYALGGVNASTARRLIGTGAIGFAAVDAIANPQFRLESGRARQA